MKNKKGLTYLMLVLVIGIWGKIVHDIFFTGNDDGYVSTIEEPMYEVLDNKESFEYELIADYRDPFLGKSSANRSPRVVKSRTVKKQAPVQVKKTNKKWPKISYNGKMKNKSNMDATAFVKINDRDALMKAGEVRNEIKLLEIFKDSVWMEFDEEKRTFVYQKK